MLQPQQVGLVPALLPAPLCAHRERRFRFVYWPADTVPAENIMCQCHRTGNGHKLWDT